MLDSGCWKTLSGTRFSHERRPNAPSESSHAATGLRLPWVRRLVEVRYTWNQLRSGLILGETVSPKTRVDKSATVRARRSSLVVYWIVWRGSVQPSPIKCPSSASSSSDIDSAGGPPSSRGSASRSPTSSSSSLFQPSNDRNLWFGVARIVRPSPVVSRNTGLRPVAKARVHSRFSSFHVSVLRAIT